MPPLPRAEISSCTARRISLAGRVQGLGVRPAIARLARELQLCGQVANRLHGVEITLEGTPELISRFETLLFQRLPKGACIAECRSVAEEPAGRREFSIVEDQSRGVLHSIIPPDVAICPQCLNETADPRNRRFEFPWTSCTRCGPRYSIVREMPYERHCTTMNSFSQCSECAREYSEAEDARFHSQTNCCAACGPQLTLTDGRDLRGTGTIAWQSAAEALRNGKIVAVRGMGGYHLMCDAASSSAVTRLRTRKRRPSKPLAVLVSDLVAAERLAILNDAERNLLCSPENPIVLVEARAGIGLAPEIAPGLRRIGLLLPGTAVQKLLCERAGVPLVATSGNREGEPLEYAVSAAERNLAGIADLFLHHNRDIVQPVDDSIVQRMAGRTMVLRCARGFAPLPLEFPRSAPPLLALGGEQKGACAYFNGKVAVLGPYVGDLTRLESRERFLAVEQRMRALYGGAPQALACDAHPDYFTTRWAAEQTLPRVAIQHHHAHAVAGMLEAGWCDQTVLALGCDGTGYGDDGTVWGGEFLLATLRDFRRVGRFRPFSLPGGTAAVHEPWRTAVSVLLQAGENAALSRLAQGDRTEREISQLGAVVNNPRFSPLTTSAGRLCDAVAALVLSRDRSEFDGQLPMLLEAACDEAAQGTYPLPVSSGDILECDWRPLIHSLVADRNATLGERAMRFHRGLAAGLVEAVRQFPGYPVVLTGGLFQNRILAELVVAGCREAGRSVWLPGLIPVNDGGLAAGQLAVAAARLSAKKQVVR